MIALHSLNNRELEELARMVAHTELERGNRKSELILALCDRLQKPDTDPKLLTPRYLK